MKMDTPNGVVQTAVSIVLIFQMAFIPISTFTSFMILSTILIITMGLMLMVKGIKMLP